MVFFEFKLFDINFVLSSINTSGNLLIEATKTQLGVLGCPTTLFTWRNNMKKIECNICNKIFKSERALQGHSRMHGTSNGTNRQIMCCCIITREEVKVSYLEKFQESLITCKQCHKLFKSRARAKLCSKSCSTTYTNTKRGKGWTSKYCGLKISKTLKLRYAEKNPSYPHVVGDYTEVRFSKCRVTGKIYISRKGDICFNSPYIQKIPIVQYRRACAFKFDLKDYPLEFAQNIPMYSGRRNPDPDAYSKDHILSVADGFINNISPDILSHPANCRLIPHSKNSSKSYKSEITLEELMIKITEWDKKYQHY